MIAVRYALLLLALLAHALSKHTKGQDSTKCILVTDGHITPHVLENAVLYYDAPAFELHLPMVPNCDVGSYVEVCVDDRRAPSVSYVSSHRVQVYRNGARGMAVIHSGEYCPDGAHLGALGHTRLPAPKVTPLNDRD